MPISEPANVTVGDQKGGVYLTCRWKDQPDYQQGAYEDAHQGSKGYL